MKKSILISLLLAVALVSPLFAKSKKSAAAAEEETVQSDVPEMGVFSDWKKVRSRRIDKVFGSIRIRVLPGRGTFNIGAVNEREKTISILSNMNEYTSTYFSLRCGKKIYKLHDSADVKTKARLTDDKVQIIYSVNGTADVLVEFIPVESQYGEGYDVLRIQTTVTNTGKKAAEFALKNVMDTVLGEADLYHFYTADNVPIKSEASFRTMANARYFNSKNKAAWCQFLLDGADVTPTDIVALGNYATVDSSTWEPDMSSYRTFDTVTSYNNSAVGILWPAKRLSKMQTMQSVYYIAFATDGNIPFGEEFINLKTAKMKNSAAAAGIIAGTKKPIETSEVVTETQEQEEVSEVISVSKEPTKTVIDEEPSSKNLPKELLTPEYVDGLLKRIDELKSGDQTINKEELKTLNDELDFILSIMRS